LGITSEQELRRSLFFGELFESFVAVEILKSQANQGARKDLYYFRDQQGLEADFLIPRPNAGLRLLECKAGKTVRSAMAVPLLSLRRALRKRRESPIIVHRKSRSAPATAAITSGVEATDLERFVADLTHDRAGCGKTQLVRERRGVLCEGYTCGFVGHCAKNPQFVLPAVPDGGVRHIVPNAADALSGYNTRFANPEEIEAIARARDVLIRGQAQFQCGSRKDSRTTGFSQQVLRKT
jgi:hypothetical protein